MGSSTSKARLEFSKDAQMCTYDVTENVENEWVDITNVINIVKVDDWEVLSFVGNEDDRADVQDDEEVL